MKSIQESSHHPLPIQISISGNNGNVEKAIACCVLSSLKNLFQFNNTKVVYGGEVIDGDAFLESGDAEIEQLEKDCRPDTPLQVNVPGQKKMLVDVTVIEDLLRNLNGPGHYIRELQVTRFLPGTNNNAINLLQEQYDEYKRRTKE